MSEKRLQPVTERLLIVQFVLGLVAFFVFFSALFNGLDRLALAAASIGLLVNLLVSALIAKRRLVDGAIAAVVFAGPALLPAALSLGDLLVYGKVGPLLFWLSVALATAASGLLGVLLAWWRSGGRQSGLNS